MTSNFILGNLPQGPQDSILKRHLCLHAHCRTHHNSLNLEATQVSENGRVEKEMTVYTQWNTTQLDAKMKLICHHVD